MWPCYYYLPCFLVVEFYSNWLVLLQRVCRERQSTFDYDSINIESHSLLPYFLQLAINFTFCQAMYKQSLEQPDEFWGTAARSTLKWIKEFDRVSQGGFEQGDVAWFTGGQLNGCYNCVDQHLPKRAKQVPLLLFMNIGVTRGMNLLCSVIPLWTAIYFTN